VQSYITAAHAFVTNVEIRIAGSAGRPQLNLPLERKVAVTGGPRSLNPRKAVAIAIFPIIVYFARSMHDVACEIGCAVVMRSSNGRERP